MQPDSTVLASGPRALVLALSRYQIDTAALLRAAQIDASTLETPGARIPNRRSSRLMSLAVEATGDPCLGLVAAKHAPATTLHALGFGMMASPTIGDVLKRLVRYERIALTQSWIALEGSIVVLKLSGDPVVTACRADGVFQLLMRVCRGLLARDFAPLSVSFRHGDHGQRHRYVEAFGENVSFDAAADRFELPEGAMTAPLPGSNAVLAAEADRIVEDYLSTHELDSTTARARRALLTLLPQGEANLATVARALHMSGRSLQRQLRQGGMSYRALLDSTRKGLALEYLRRDGVSLAEAAFRTGFSDQSAFTKAFKRWTGMTPSQFAA